jgi:hypothetical protein
MIRVGRAGCIVLAMSLALFATGCATEVIDTKTSTETAATATTQAESLAGTDLEQLIAVMQSEIGALSQAVFDSNKAAARSHLDRINEAWAYAEPLIVSQFGELADQITYDLRRVVGLARSAVERNRPADASKAVAFFRLASASLNVAG